MTVDPFKILLEIEQQNLTYAKPLPEQKSVEAQWVGLGCEIQQRPFLIPLSEIKEVIQVPTMTRIEESVDWLLGLSNMRGRVLPITDLQNFILGVPLPVNKLTRVLVVEYQHNFFGFELEQVLGLKKMEAKNLKNTLDPTFPAEYSIGTVEIEGQLWPVVSLLKLIQTIKFNHIVEEIMLNATDLEDESKS